MAPDVARSIAPTIGRVLAFVAFYIVCTAAASTFLVRPLIGLAGAVGLRIQVGMYLELASAAGATAIMLRSIDRRPWGDIGMGREAVGIRRMLSGWCVGGTTIAGVCAVLWATGLLTMLPGEAGTTWAGAALRVTLVLLPSALAEEMICRGYLLTVVRDSVGVAPAVVLTSVMFGLLHLMSPGATAQSVGLVTLAGVFLAAVRLVLGSLYAAWMAHLAWNWVMAVPLHASVSGIQFEAPAYRAVTVEPAWLSGGAWGPEGGAIAALGMVAGLAYLYTRPRREES